MCENKFQTWCKILAMIQRLTIWDRSFIGTCLNVCGKKKAPCEGYFSHHTHYLANPNGAYVLKWVFNLVFKFHDDPTINEYKMIVLLKQILSVCGKKKEFGEKEKGKRIWNEERAYSKCKIWPNMSLFITRYSQPIIYSIFILFYKKELNFTPYQMNK